MAQLAMHFSMVCEVNPEAKCDGYGKPTVSFAAEYIGGLSKWELEKMSHKL